MQQIAFLFLILDNPNFPKIWNSYFRGNKDKYNIYIHPKYKEKTTWQSKNIIENLQETSWGHIVSAYIELFKEAYKNPNNMKFVTISESDVPIKSFDIFYNDCINDSSSWIKFLKIKNYNWKERINKQSNKNKPKHFIKHLARFCLNRNHVGELLQKSKEKQLEFFYKMHVGDEFFLSVLYPINNVKNFAITYDDWEYIEIEKKKIKEEKRKCYEIQEKTGKNMKNELKKLNNKFNNIAKNPKTIINVEDDLDKIKICKSYFYRKFSKDSNIEKYWKEIISYQSKLFEKNNN
jgi:hypothetical protein